jgi:hypothetical protein
MGFGFGRDGMAVSRTSDPRLNIRNLPIVSDGRSRFQPFAIPG